MYEETVMRLRWLQTTQPEGYHSPYLGQSPPAFFQQVLTVLQVTITLDVRATAVILTLHIEDVADCL